MAADIWAVADLLRGDYKRHEYGQVILPFTVLRRLDAVMAPTREAVRARDAALSMQHKEKLLEKTAGLPFYNVSKQDFKTIASDATSVAKNLGDYVNGFSENVRQILDPVRLRQPGHQAGQGEAALPGCRQIRRDARPGQAVKPRDGLCL